MSEKADNSEGNSENDFKGDNNIKNTQCVNSIERSFDINTDRLDSLFSNMQHFIYSVKLLQPYSIRTNRMSQT